MSPFKKRVTHGGLYLSEHVTQEADRPKPFVDDPEAAATIAEHVRLFISRALPQLLHYKPKRALATLDASLPGFDHAPAYVENDKPVRYVAFNLTKKRS
jgi:hypothetical protein